MSLVAKILTVPRHARPAGLEQEAPVRAGGLLFENLDGIARSLGSTACSRASASARPGWARAWRPHGRIKGLKEALGAFVRLAQPVPFDAPDGGPVSLVFVLLVPEKATEKHLQILLELAQMFSDKALRER